MKQYVCLADRAWSPSLGRTQQLLARLKNAQILYFEPPAPSETGGGRARRVRPNVLVYRLPRLLPEPELFPGLRLGERRLADFIRGRLEHHRFYNPVLWATHPRQAALLDGLAPYRGLIYDCGTYFPASMGEREGLLAQASDVIFAASSGIADHLSPCSANIAVIPNGVNFSMFCRRDPEVPAELAGLTGPVLGWAGNLTPQTDLTPLEYAAREHPEWAFVLVGALGDHPRLPALRARPNVLLVGPRLPVELPDFLMRFDVCLSLLPEDGESDVISSRTFEYLSTGNPIVSMLYEDQVEQFPDVIYGAHTPEEFSRLCAHALTEPPGFFSARRRQYGRAAAWTVRAAEVIRILEGIGLY